MRINQEDVDYVANLANLELTPEERTRLAKDLDSILTYIDRLNELDTANVPPMVQVFAQGSSGNGLREDVLRPSLAHDDAMQNAPNTDGQFFRVPKVIER